MLILSLAAVALFLFGCACIGSSVCGGMSDMFDDRRNRR